MATAAIRPTVSVYSADDSNNVLKSVPLPEVFTAPIRPHLVQFVHDQILKNRRQAYAVKFEAGMDTAAESWGTGRAVSRIPRVPGSGTHRAGQGAFGNMCRGGRMFAPTKVWRKWHVKIPLGQKRYAACSAVAASALPALVMARGHRISKVPELPLVVDNQFLEAKKTKELVAFLDKFGLMEDVTKVKDTKHLRGGKGKYRNRKWSLRKGVLVICCAGEDKTLKLAARSLKGVDICHVETLDLKQIAPGGHLGRLIVWTESAFSKLNEIFGTRDSPSELKKNFVLPRPLIANADISRVINSDEVQSAVRHAIVQDEPAKKKVNPLKSFKHMVALNPYAEEEKKQELAAKQASKEKREKVLAQKRQA